MIVVIGGIKGGTGKTTLATNLVVMRAKAKKKVLFVDADELQESYQWVEHRRNLGKEIFWSTIKLSGKHIHEELGKLSKDYDDIIIDVGGRDTTSQRSCLAVCDLLVIPLRPRTPDFWPLDDIEKIIQDIRSVNKKIKCLGVINQADHIGCENSLALELLCSYKFIEIHPSYIGMRKAFWEAFSVGCCVTEMKPNSLHAKAKEEIENLYNSIFKKNIKKI